MLPLLNLEDLLDLEQAAARVEVLVGVKEDDLVGEVLLLVQHQRLAVDGERAVPVDGPQRWRHGQPLKTHTNGNDAANTNTS